jgi:hypothetical protein
MNAEAERDAIQSLQDAIYRDKVLRARALTPAQRLAEAFELSNDIFHWMHSGAMAQCKLTDSGRGWEEVSRRLSPPTCRAFIRWVRQMPPR